MNNLDSPSSLALAQGLTGGKSILCEGLWDSAKAHLIRHLVHLREKPLGRIRQCPVKIEEGELVLHIARLNCIPFISHRDTLPDHRAAMQSPRQ